jgi:hypothetical protein
MMEQGQVVKITKIETTLVNAEMRNWGPCQKKPA